MAISSWYIISTQQRPRVAIIFVLLVLLTPRDICSRPCHIGRNPKQVHTTVQEGLRELHG